MAKKNSKRPMAQAIRYDKYLKKYLVGKIEFSTLKKAEEYINKENNENNEINQI